MMESLASPAVATLGGVAAITIAWKVLWPLLKGFVENQTTRSGTESGLLIQTSAEMTKALLRADEERELRIKAEAIANDYFVKFTQLQAKFEVILEQVKNYEAEAVELRAEVAELRTVVRQIKGASNA